jgi:hypothetical protein
LQADLLFLGRLTGFPFVVVSCPLFFCKQCVFRTCGIRQLTKKSAAISTSYHCNPCRSAPAWYIDTVTGRLAIKKKPDKALLFD